MLIDSHCHLDFPDFAGELDAVVARAQAAGIARIVTISTRVKRHGEVLAIAERFPDVYCSVGTHPHNAHEELDIGLDALIERSRHPKVVAIGEAGLDYHYDHSPRHAQERSFRNHIAAARDTGLPLVIHSREAEPIQFFGDRPKTPIEECGCSRSILRIVVRRAHGLPPDSVREAAEELRKPRNQVELGDEQVHREHRPEVTRHLIQPSSDLAGLVLECLDRPRGQCVGGHRHNRAIYRLLRPSLLQ